MNLNFIFCNLQILISQKIPSVKLNSLGQHTTTRSKLTWPTFSVFRHQTSINNDNNIWMGSGHLGDLTTSGWSAFTTLVSLILIVCEWCFFCSSFISYNHKNKQLLLGTDYAPKSTVAKTINSTSSIRNSQKSTLKIIILNFGRTIVNFRVVAIVIKLLSSKFGSIIQKIRTRVA